MMFAIIFLYLFTYTTALPDGAPPKACQSMVPNHGGIVRQQGPSPYSVKVLRHQGDVFVTVKSSIDIPLQGLLLQGRLQGGEVAGTFETTSNDVKTIDCIQSGDSVTHSHPGEKSAVEVRWKPPAGYVGPVVFNATIAQDYSRFWVGVESETVQLDKNFKDDAFFEPRPKTSTPPHFAPEDTTAAPRRSNPFYEGCTRTKLCFGTPNGCVSAKNCKAIVAVTVKGERYEFELMAHGNPVWVGVGLSPDNNKMGDDSVLECVKETSQEVKAYLSWNKPRPDIGNTRVNITQRGIEMLNRSIVDDTLYCKVRRDVRTTINGKPFDLAKMQYYILVASGTRLKENSVGFHDIGYLPTASMRYLSDVSSVEGASKLFLRLHGAFMLAAWIGTASLGTFIARYYRKTWVGRTICGKDLWFAWHRFFMVLTWALTTVAFVLIFVELKEWSSETAHAVLGCIVTGLCFLQPIGAFFRPHPGTSKRPIFNWVHWFGGNTAHIVAIIAIFFAAKMNKAELPEWFDWILAAFVVFHVVMHLVLSILGCVSENSSSQRITAFPMKELSSSGKMTSHMVNMDAPYSGGRKLLLGLYVLVVGAFTAALIVVAVLAPITL